MRKYETFFIVDPELTEEAYTIVGDKLKGIVDANGGTVLSYVSWGKKKLAYPVKKRHQGHYILMENAGGPELVAELERNMRLDERVLKFITVKLEDRFDPEKEEARKLAAEQALRADEEVPAKEAEGLEEYEAVGEEGPGEEEQPS